MPHPLRENVAMAESTQAEVISGPRFSRCLVVSSNTAYHPALDKHQILLMSGERFVEDGQEGFRIRGGLPTAPPCADGYLKR